jgi:hypothetical protein
MESQDFPANPSSEEWCRLLQDTLGKKEGAAVAASLGCGEVVINVTSTEDQASGQMRLKEKSGALCKVCSRIYNIVSFPWRRMHTTYS